MKQRKYLPASTGEFKKIRRENMLYVDKTEIIYSLLDKGEGKYFLRRSRRFGKSLTISTLEALLQGHKDLFEGLWIYDKWHWKPYNVIRFDFSKIGRFKNEDELDDMINDIIIDVGEMHNVVLDMSQKWLFNLKILIKKLKAKGLVAILIDEYESPFHKALNISESLLNLTKTIFTDFYGLLKALDLEYDFLFITGITKIAKTSLYSSVNTLEDLTLRNQFAGLCGITQSELELYFSPHIEHMASMTKTKKSKRLKTYEKCTTGIVLVLIVLFVFTTHSHLSTPLIQVRP